MKKTIISIVCLVTAQMVYSDDIIVTVDFDSTVSIAEQLCCEWPTVDSLVMLGGPIDSKDMEPIVDFIHTKKVRGVDASKATFVGDELPELAFWPLGPHAALRYITLPSTLKRMGVHCLYQAPITELVIPEGVTELAWAAMFQCKQLRRLQLPTTLTIIGDNALSELECLEELQLPFGLETIGTEALYGLGKTVTEVLVPSTVTTIGPMAFFMCKGLRRVALPAPLTDINDDTFHGCDSLQQVEWPAALRTIGVRAFRGCGFRQLRLPEGVSDLGAYAFAVNPRLEEVVLPASLQRLCATSFVWCDSITSMTCRAEVPPTVENDALESHIVPPASATLYVPAESVEAYRSASYWASFVRIEPIQASIVQTTTVSLDHGGRIYNLNGVSTPTPPLRGLHIRNGRKVLVR